MIILIKLFCLIGLLYGSYLVLRLVINIKEWDHDYDHDVNENVQSVPRIPGIPRCGSRSCGSMYAGDGDSVDKGSR
jgi:hypothetical protein